MQSRSKQAVMLKVKTRVADPVYLVQSGSVLNILIQIPPKNKLFFRYPGGKQNKKLPRRQNDRPHHPLVLCSNLPDDHGHFNEVNLEFKTKLRKTKMTTRPDDAP